MGFTYFLLFLFLRGLFALQYNNCTFFCLFVLCSFLIKNQFLCFYSLCFLSDFPLFAFVLFVFHDFSCLHVCMSVVVCILFVVLLFTEGTSVSEIYFHYSSKTDFSHFSCLFARIHFQLFSLLPLSC